MNFLKINLLPEYSRIYGARKKLTLVDFLLIACVMTTLFLLTYWITPMFGLLKPSCLLAAIIVSVNCGITIAWVWLYPESETILGNCIGLAIGMIAGGALIGSGLSKVGHHSIQAAVKIGEIRDVFSLQKPFITGFFLGLAYLSLWGIIRILILRIIRSRNPTTQSLSLLSIKRRFDARSE